MPQLDTTVYVVQYRWVLLVLVSLLFLLVFVLLPWVKLNWKTRNWAEGLRGLALRRSFKSTSVVLNVWSL
uniref:ATP synthase subunit 8 n=1 Tax=Paraconotrochus antarcticus TaxID=2666516 RepID=A0A7T1S054_9CNID|nr:ATP synthase F0 subunit 8 [Paraconotrochus antarcticus]QPO84684.1 ATP synthase subunit 8 [Paraconotrochus antarcticus]